MFKFTNYFDPAGLRRREGRSFCSAFSSDHRPRHRLALGETSVPARGAGALPLHQQGETSPSSPWLRWGARLLK